MAQALQRRGRMNQTNSEAANAVATNWVETHGDYLFNFAIGQVRDTSVAEDLARDVSPRSNHRTIFRALLRAHRLVGILRHKLYDHLRKTPRGTRRARRTLPAHDDGEASTNPSSDSPDRRGIRFTESSHRTRRVSRSIWKGDGQTAAPHRASFQLYSVEERPNHEVCERLNISESNLWVMLHRACKTTPRGA